MNFRDIIAGKSDKERKEDDISQAEKLLKRKFFAYFSELEEKVAERERLVGKMYDAFSRDPVSGAQSFNVDRFAVAKNEIEFYQTAKGNILTEYEKLFGEPMPTTQAAID